MKKSLNNGRSGVNTLNLEFEWLTSGNDSPEIQQTMGMFGLQIGNVSLTENEDIWSKTVRNTVLVSAYPLAAWIASSWWRLRFEPLPPAGLKPTVDWRMAHELTAANQGFIWPRVIFASDHDSMQIWSISSKAIDKQSVRYLNSLDRPVSINLTEFEQKTIEFIERVIHRLDAMGVRDTPLANLWQGVQEERSDAYSTRYRRCEAELGFDPDECPENIVKTALNLAEKIGHQTFSELAPVCAYANALFQPEPFATIVELANTSGIKIKPDIPIEALGKPEGQQAPWQRAIAAASHLRHAMDLREKPIENCQLYALLGLQETEYEAWSFPKRSIAVAVPSKGKEFNFHPRKRHPIAQRFELVRLIGDYLCYGDRGESWLASTDLGTARQKYQRAFAAEFLCPLEGLLAYLDNDYSESALEDAAAHFRVSSQTIESILINNGVLTTPSTISYAEVSIPY